jgi:hypothetical protein
MNSTMSPTEPAFAVNDGYTVIPAQVGSAPLRDLVYAHHLGMPTSSSETDTQTTPRPPRTPRRQRGARAQRKR